VLAVHTDLRRLVAAALLGGVQIRKISARADNDVPALLCTVVLRSPWVDTYGATNKAINDIHITPVTRCHRNFEANLWRNIKYGTGREFRENDQP